MLTTWSLKEQCLSARLIDVSPVEHTKGKSKDLLEASRKIYLKDCVGTPPQDRDVHVGLVAALEASRHLCRPGSTIFMSLHLLSTKHFF